MMIGDGAPRRPLLRYHGSKHRLSSWLIGHFPPHQRFVDAFGGGGNVLAQKPRSQADIYNDLNEEVVNVFRVLRDPAHAMHLQRMLALTPFARKEYEQSFEPSADPVEQARRTLVRSFFSFGTTGLARPSGFRAGYRKDGNHVATEWQTLADHIPSWAARFQGVLIECLPAITCLQKYDSPGTLHYLDPPYLHETRTAYAVECHRGYAHEMSNGDHEAMIECVRALAGMVIISGYPSALYDDLLSGWQRIDRATHAEGSRPRTECLWINSAAMNSRNQIGMNIEALL